MLTPPGRAVTDEQKRAVMERLLAAWMKRPALRLGQMLAASTPDGRDVFYVEDWALVEFVDKIGWVVKEER